MTRRARWLLLVAGAVVVAGGVAAWLVLGRRPPQPADFTASAVPIESTTLAFETDEVRGVVRDGRTQWRCLLRCREAGGCHAQLRVTVHYLSAGAPRVVTFADTVHAGLGEVAVIGGNQRPAEVVDAIQHLKVVVEQRLDGEHPRPIRYE